MISKKDEIWEAINKCFGIKDVIWYDDFTTLYDQIGFILDRKVSGGDGK